MILSFTVYLVLCCALLGAAILYVLLPMPVKSEETQGPDPQASLRKYALLAGTGFIMLSLVRLAGMTSAQAMQDSNAALGAAAVSSVSFILPGLFFYMLAGSFRDRLSNRVMLFSRLTAVSFFLLACVSILKLLDIGSRGGLNSQSMFGLFEYGTGMLNNSLVIVLLLLLYRAFAPDMKRISTAAALAAASYMGVLAFKCLIISNYITGGALNHLLRAIPTMVPALAMLACSAGVLYFYAVFFFRTCNPDAENCPARTA